MIVVDMVGVELVLTGVVGGVFLGGGGGGGGFGV